MSTSSSPTSYSYETHSREPNPKSAALLVIDMQNYFSMATPILPPLNSTIDICRAASIPVIFTRHRHKSPSDHAMLGEWWGSPNLIADGTSESELVPGLSRREGEDPIFEKFTYSAFFGTGLEEALRERGIEEVIITGVMTNLCCETTARDAFIRGFRVFFSADATATSNLDLHQSTLKNMAHGFAYIVDCARLKAAFSSSKQA